MTLPRWTNRPQIWWQDTGLPKVRLFLDAAGKELRHRTATTRHWAADSRTQKQVLRYGPLVVAVVLLALILGSIKNVTVQIDGKVLSARTTARSVQTALKHMKVSLAPGDEADPPLETHLSPGSTVTVTVRRAVPVTVTVDGKTLKVVSARPTVQDMLVQQGVTVGALDKVLPKADAPLAKDLAVKVVRVTEKTVTETWEIPYQRSEREDSSLLIGTTEVVQEGRPGTQEVTIKYVYEDGVETGNKIIDQKIMAEPVAELVAVGTTGILNRGGTQIRFVKAMDMIATAYDPGPISTGAYSDGYTAIGLKATYGVVAVDPRVIPLRSRLYIDGYGYAIAGDTGSAIKGNRIDLCYDTYEEAIRFGRRPVTVYILQYP